MSLKPPPNAHYVPIEAHVVARQRPKTVSKFQALVALKVRHLAHNPLVERLARDLPVNSA